MKRLNDAIKSTKMEVLSSKKLPGEELLRQSSKILNFKFGTQLAHYLTRFGFLAFGHVELLGVNCNQGILSDLILKNLRLREECSILKDYLCIEDMGDRDFVLIDPADQIFRFNPESQKIPLKQKMDLEEYLLKRLEDSEKFAGR